MDWARNIGDYFTQFGKRDVTPQTVRVEEESFAPMNLPDAVITRASGGFISTSLNYHAGALNEIEKIDGWRSIAQCPEMAWAINEICNDAIVQDGDKYQCELTFDEECDLPKKIKEKLSVEFRNVLRLLNFKRNGLDLFRQWYIDGKVYYHGVLDPNNLKKGMIGIRWIDPRNIKRVVEVKEEKDERGVRYDAIKEDYYVYNSAFGYKTNYGFNQYSAQAPINQTIIVNPECIAYSNSGVFFENGDGTNFSLSYLESAVKAFNTMTSLEQAMTIYRIARAPERRVFYIDTGNLQKDKADQYLANVMARFKRKLTFNNATGAVTTENGELGIMDDFWLPRKEGGRGTEVTTLTSGAAWSDMNDLEWFQKKVLRGLNIPFGRFQNDSMFSSGRSMEITREEVKFSKFIAQLRNKYSQALIQLLKIQIIAKNIMSIEDFEKYANEFNVRWNTDAYWDELLFNEMWQTRLNLASQFGDMVGKYVSNEWIQRNVLQQTEQDIAQMREQILKERNDEIYNHVPPEE